MSDTITISINELATMEAHFQEGLKFCCRLKKKLGPAATGSSSRKGSGAKRRAHLITVRRRGVLRRAS